MSMREKTQADFDLEQMFDMLDTALTSRDERVQSALRALLTIVALTKPQDDGKMAVETKHGPLRQMQQDLDNLRSRIANVENQLRQTPMNPAPYNVPASPMGPYVNPSHPSAPGTWWGADPNAPWTTTTGAVTGDIGYISPQTKAKELK